MHLGEAISQMKQMEKKKIQTREQKQKYIKLLRTVISLTSGKVQNYYKKLISSV
jgi:hypothetical protein